MKKETLVFFVIAVLILSCTFSNPVAIVFATSTPTNSATLTMTPTLTPTPFPPATATPTRTPTPFQSTFGPPLDIPKDFDELYMFIETGHRGYVFDRACTPEELTGPYISWNMVKEAVATETPERQHPCLQLWGNNISRIIAPGGGYFPNENRLITVHENDVFLKLFEIEWEPIQHFLYDLCQAESKSDPENPNPACPLDQPNPFDEGTPIFACGDGYEKPIGYGPGIQVFLDWLAIQPEMTINQCVEKYPPSSPEVDI